MNAQKFLSLIAWLGSAVWSFGQEAKSQATFQGHSHTVLSVAFSPDGKMLASAGVDKTVRLWDVADVKEPVAFQGHRDTVFSVAFSPDGKTLASGSGDGTARLWDVATSKCRSTLMQAGWVMSVAFSPDGKTLATASDKGQVRLWDVDIGRRKSVLDGHNGCIHSLAFSPDGSTLVSGSEDRTIRLWDVAAGRSLEPWVAHEGGVRAVAFSPDGKMLASAGADRTVKVWEVATRKLRSTLRGHEDWVVAVTFSPDGKTLASGSVDWTLRLWETATGKERMKFTEHTERVAAVSFHPGGGILASGSEDKTVKLWKLPTAEAEGKAIDLSAADLDHLWDQLTEPDAGKGFQAVRRLLRSPRQAVALIQKRLPPAEEPKQLAQWLADLDSARFPVRQQATEALEKLGEQAESALRLKLAQKPTLEVRQRIERILDRIEPRQLHPEIVRGVRAVEVLERIGSADAGDVLKKLATGDESARLTREAKTALARRNKRATVARMP